MKLLYSFILLMYVLKLAAPKPSNVSLVYNISSSAANLVTHYDDEYNLLAEETCPKLKYITDEILKDIVLQKTFTPLMQTLKKNLTEFQQYYPYFKRFGFNARLMSEFSDLVKGFYYSSTYDNDKDFLYIKEMLKKFGYNDIRKENQDKFKTFLDQKLLIKFEQLQTEIISKSKNSEQDSIVLKWISELKECKYYECFLIDFETYEKMHGRLLNRIFGEVFRHISKGLTIQAHNTTIFAQAVLKDSKLSKLSAPIQQQLTKNLQDITKLEENFYEFDHIYIFMETSYHILYRFDDYTSISPAERQLITNLFNEHDYKSLHFEDNKRELAKTDYIAQYEAKIAALRPKVLQQVKNILEVLDRLINASTSQDKAEARLNFDNALKEK